MYLKILPRKLLLSSYLFILITLFGCQATLAPAYDQAIVDGVTENTELALRFFASVEGGTVTEEYKLRENTYNVLIGSFESLKIQSRARPMPDNEAVNRINEMLRDTGREAIHENYPSAFAFGRIAETFRKMKEFDSEGPMNVEVIESLKGQVEIYLEQAITYESFLKR